MYYDLPLSSRQGLYDNLPQTTSYLLRNYRVLGVDRIKVEEVIIVNSFYYCFLPFIISTINSLYIGFSNHQIIIFINFLSLMILLFIGLIIFRLLSLSFFLSLIYSVAIIITFIFVIMILDQSEILLRENYNFIPLGLLIILGVTWVFAYSICHDSANLFHLK